MTLEEYSLSCSDLLAGTLTLFVRIQFELGCGGMKAWGALPEEDVYNQQTDPLPESADCDLTEFNPDEVMGEVVEEVFPCSEEVL